MVLDDLDCWRPRGGVLVGMMHGQHRVLERLVLLKSLNLQTYLFTLAQRDVAGVRCRGGLVTEKIDDRLSRSRMCRATPRTFCRKATRGPSCATS